MNLEQIIQIATLLSVLSGFAGIVVGLFIYRRQVNTQVFLQYAKRYEEVMAMFPEGARAARLALDGEPPPASEELSLAVLRYLNLCSEEFYLCQRGYLSQDIWNIWEDELRRTLASTLLVREWSKLRIEFRSYPEFLRYVDQLQAAKSSQVAPHNR